VRRTILASASVGLAIGSTQAAHSIAYRLVEPSAEERAHLLAGTGHAYLQHATLALALVSVLAVLALVSELRAGATGSSMLSPQLWMFVVVAPATFVVQEHFERWFHDGAFPVTASFEKTFAIGFVLQLPFAALAYVLARAFLRAARSIGLVLAQRRVCWRAFGPSWGVVRSELRASLTLLGRLGARAPPLAAC
jgi:hypothetical protein